jgi:hypothetical protein
MKRSEPKYEVGLNALIEIDENGHPLDFMIAIETAINLIEKYSNRLRRELSRVRWYEMWEDVYVEWGVFSHKVNKVIRSRIKELEGTEDEILLDIQQRLIYCYAYWWNRHHWIEKVIRKRSKYSGLSVHKNIKKGKRTLEKCICGEFKQELSPQFKNLLAAFKNKDYKKEFSNEDLNI